MANQNLTTSIAFVIRELRGFHRHAQKSTIIDGLFTILNLLVALAFTLWMPPWTPLPSLVIAWCMYRKYLHCRWREHRLLEALNHAQRIYVETPERAADHHHELTFILAQLRLLQ